MEKKTKGDRRRVKASDDVYHVLDREKLLSKKRGTSVSVISALQAELLQARCRIRMLEAKKQSLRKKVKHLLNKLEDERISSPRRERLKNYAATDELRDELIKERKSRQMMEILNTKLVNQLANVKLSAEQLMQGYEEEKKSRELVEDVCDKLVKQFGEDKAEVERLKEEYIKVREELEEERKMLQLAEVWREERVQMKLVDAKLALEDKYSKMNMLITDLETLLGSTNCSLDVVELRKADKILQAAAESLSIQDMIEEFSYVPPKSNDLFSILKELQECEGDAREIGHRNSHIRDNSGMASPQFSGFSKNHHPTYSNCLGDYNSALEEDAGICDAANSAAYRSSTPANTPLKKVNREKYVSRNGIERDEAGQWSPKTEVSEASVSNKKLKQNASATPKDRRSKPSDGIYKTEVSNESDKRMSNGMISCPETTSPDRQRGEGEGEARHRGHCISAGLANPHITRGMKGRIEWPRAIQKNVFKAKVSEAIIESQKSQLRHILKPKT